MIERDVLVIEVFSIGHRGDVCKKNSLPAVSGNGEKRNRQRNHWVDSQHVAAVIGRSGKKEASPQGQRGHKRQNHSLVFGAERDEQRVQQKPRKKAAVEKRSERLDSLQRHRAEIRDGHDARKVVVGYVDDDVVVGEIGSSE